MSRATLAAYLAVPAVLALGGFLATLRREPLGMDTVAAVLIGGYLFYAGPHLLWVLIAALGNFSSALWHAGLLASSLALVAIAVLWLLPPDPSGLPMQWLLYWPLAVILQIVLGGLTALVRRG